MISIISAHCVQIHLANFESMGFELVYEEKVKEVTMSEVEAKFGCKVKIKNND